MIHDASAPPPNANATGKEPQSGTNSNPLPPPRGRPSDHSHNQRHKRNIDGSGNGHFNGHGPRHPNSPRHRNFNHRGDRGGRHNIGPGPGGRGRHGGGHFNRDNRRGNMNMNHGGPGPGPGFRNQSRGPPMGPGPGPGGPNNFQHQPGQNNRMNHNGKFGHGPGPGRNAGRGPPPPPPRMGNFNNNRMQTHNGRPPPPPPHSGGRLMNQNFRQPNFQAPGQVGSSFNQNPPPHHHQQQYFQQQQDVPNGLNNQHQHPYPQSHPHQGPNQPFPSYQSMGSQSVTQNALSSPNVSGGHNIQPAPTMSIGHHPAPIASVSQSIPSNPNDAPSNWSTHKSPEGVDFFYNSVTRQSQYDRPACLGGPAVNMNATTGNASTTTNASATQPVNAGEKRSQNGWTQLFDAKSGKVYYYNGTITTWDKPDDFEDPSAEDSSAPPPSKRKKKKTEKERPVLYNNKAEAIAAFKGLLLAKDISPAMKWNEVVKICSSDQRWEACTTTGERKQSLAEYQTKRANALREAMRQEKMRAKDAFMSLLTDVLPSTSAFNATSGTAFQDIRDFISKDDRFHSVEQEETREELYLDFVEEVRKKNERQRRGRKREAKEAFLQFLKSKEMLTYASTWPLFLKSLDENDKTNKIFAVSLAMSDSERQLYFADYVIELTAIEDEKRRRIREARRRAEKAQRNAFRETLKQYARDGKILPSSRWRNVEEALTAEDSFNPVKEQDRNEPRNIFDDFIDEWADLYHGDRVFLNNLVSKSKNLVLNTDSNYEDFTKFLLDAAAYSPDIYSDTRRVINDEIPISSAKLFFDEMVSSGKLGSSRGRAGTIQRINVEESSEDEGEIIEDGEVPNDEGKEGTGDKEPPQAETEVSQNISDL